MGARLIRSEAGASIAGVLVDAVGAILAAVLVRLLYPLGGVAVDGRVAEGWLRLTSATEFRYGCSALTPVPVPAQGRSRAGGAGGGCRAARA